MSVEPNGFDPVHLYEYMRRAREKLLDFVRPLSTADYTREFPFGHKTIRSTLVHTAAAEWTYNRRLHGEPVPPIEDRPFTRFYEAEFAPFEAAWRAQSEETKRTLRGIPDWARPVEFVTSPPPGTRRAEPGQTVTHLRTTTGGLAAQLLFHEVHHRAQVMAMLRHLGLAAQVFDYSALMFERREAAE